MTGARKVAFITGASAGIGEALARELAKRGYDLILSARRVDRLERLAAELVRGGARAIAVEADVNRDGDVERAVARGVTALGRLDLVVANAGYSADGQLSQLGIEDYRRQFETNVFGVLRAIYAGLPELRKTRGSVAVIGSIAGFVSLPGNTAYSMSKAALMGLCQGLSTELEADGISVTHIQPGFIHTEIFQVDRKGVWHPTAKEPPPAWLTMPAEKAARQMARAILGRRRQITITLHGKLIVLIQRFLPGMMRLALKRSI